MNLKLADELIDLNRKLLESIVSGDWATYESLCDPSLTAFEPEAQGQLVQGMEFHRFYFQHGKSLEPCSTTIVAPHVHLLGSVAVVSYVRLIQHLDRDGQHVTSRFAETRVWQKQQGDWKHVHFHRS
jgi:calcium/calmodulin-dependent protein kinase (CaM kinase) II